jgi:hypothetical protein
MNTYQILEPLVEEPIILTAQTTIEETLSLPSEEIKQSTQFGSSITKNEKLLIAYNVAKIDYTILNLQCVWISRLGGRRRMAVNIQVKN